MPRNVELKARLRDLAAATQVAQRLATARLGSQRQVDTYFLVAAAASGGMGVTRPGRLKLREVAGGEAQLIWYARADQSGPKASDYLIAPVDQPEALKLTLVAALGVHAVVDKQREIYLFHNVRIHLDQVMDLGNFLEFEAVLGPSCDQRAGREQVDYLKAEFGISPSDLLDCSYSDLIVRASTPR